MKVKKKLVVALLVSAGFKTADKFNDVRILKKVEELKDHDWGDATPSSPKLLDSLISAVENGDKITLTEDEVAAEEEAKPSKTAAKSKSKKTEVEEETPAGKKTKSKSKKAEVEEEAEEGEEETKAVPKKVKKEKAAKKEKAPKGPGVIATILELLKKATVKKPISKDGLLEGLKKVFPDREDEAMMATINAQVPSRLSKEKGVVISKNDKGYWIEKSED